MATTFVQRSDTSDLSGGGEYSRQLLEGTAAVSDLLIALAASQTKTGHSFTEAGVPGADGVAGNYTVEVDIAIGDTSVMISAAVGRVNSAGTLQAESAFSTEQTAAGAVLTFNFTNPALGTWAAGDRLRVAVRYRNSHTHTGRNVTVSFNTAESEVVAPWTAAANNFDETGRAVTIASTVTGADAVAFTETLMVTATSTLTVSDVQSGTETLTVIGTTTVTVTDEQLPYYAVFRRAPTTGAVFDPDVDTPIATTTENTYLDENLAAATYDYQVFRWNGSAWSSGSNVEQATVAAGNNFDETGRTVSITSTVVGTDAQAITESRSIAITATVTASDTAGLAESGQIAAATTVEAADVLGATETLSTAISATVTATDQLGGLDETGRQITVTATVTATDTAAMVDAVTVTVVATVTAEDSGAFTEALAIVGNVTTTASDEVTGAFDETGRALDIVATVTATDIGAFTEALEVDITSTVTGTGAAGYFETLGVSVAATVTATDSVSSGFTENVTVDITATVTGSDQWSAMETSSLTITATLTEADIAAFVELLEVDAVIELELTTAFHGTTFWAPDPVGYAAAGVGYTASPVAYDPLGLDDPPPW